jgi:hypothetical protein
LAKKLGGLTLPVAGAGITFALRSDRFVCGALAIIWSYVQNRVQLGAE